MNDKAMNRSDNECDSCSLVGEGRISKEVNLSYILKKNKEFSRGLCGWGNRLETRGMLGKFL